jgi:MSHA biogenesis protein MshP
MNRVHPAREQRGFALVGALFVLVILAALGAFAVRMNMTQQHATDLELQEQRAQAALHAGIEYAAARLLGGGNCASLAPLPNLPGGFNVTFDPNCGPTPHQVNANTINVFTVTVTATLGAYGTPDFVSRTVSVRVR